jgi:ABC-type branched-subunit amino acid transport system substrate-binding protein
MTRLDRRTVLKAGAATLAGSAFAAPAFAQTQGVSADKIVFGCHLDLSGPTAAGMAPIRNGLAMKMDEVNAKGGVHGRKLEIVIEDSGLNPAKAVRAVEKLVGDDKVFAVVSSFGSGPTIASHGVALKAGVPHLFPWSGVSAPFHKDKHPLSFTSVVNYDWGTAAGVSWAIKTLKPKKIGLLFQDDAFGQLVEKGVMDALKANNMTLAGKAGFKPADVDLSAQMTALRKAEVDLVVMATVIRQTIGAPATAKQMGWNVPLLTSIPGRNEIVTALAARGNVNIDGLYGIGQWVIHDKTTNDAKVKAWIDAYEAKFKTPVDNGAMVAYGLMEWTVLALEKAGKAVTAANFADALRATPYKDPFGNPEQSLADGNHAKPETVAIDQIKGGKWVRVSDWIRSV